MTIADIKEAAEKSGITAVITNSTERIETQLNRITGIEELPIMLVSWDLETDLSFDTNGFLTNPLTRVVLLLMTKSESNEKDEYEKAAEEMSGIYQIFLQNLNSHLVKYNKLNGPSITNAGYTLVPRHGAGKHSGILGKFTMIGEIKNC